MSSRTAIDAENALRDALARENLSDPQIVHWLPVFQPRLDSAGRYRRSTGACISVAEIVKLVLASEAAQAAGTAPQPPTPLPDFLRSLREKFIAERERTAREPRSLESVLARLESPLSRIVPGN
jgi:hypothetical protein